MSLLKESNEEVEFVSRLLGNTNYVVEDKISQGSYGDLFRIKNKTKNKVMALKVLHVEMLKKQNKYHEAVIESIILRKLSHPFIIKAYEVIELPQFLCIVLDFCPFGDLFRLMGQITQDIALGKRKKEIVAYYFSQLLQGLNYLHSLGIVHRDIKPQNIMIGPDLKLRIIDFGTAKVINQQFYTALEIQKIKQSDHSSQQTRKSFVGSAQYLSPEAIRSNFSEKSDIWAFGVMIFKFFENAYPFEGDSVPKILEKITQGNLKMSKDLLPEVQQLIQLCLKKEASDRPTAKMLQLCSLFKDQCPKIMHERPPPLHKENLAYMENVSQNQFQIILEKKMFFGNFKPRVLVIFKFNEQLRMGYKYLQSQMNKNQFQLGMNDYCERTHQHQFRIVTQDKNYQFRIEKNKSIFNVVEKINSIIKEHYNLQ